MVHRSATAVLPLVPLAVLLTLGGSGRPDAPRAAFNDNRDPGGRFVAGALELDLEVGPARWYLLGDDKAPGEVLAFAERGKAPQIPGPLLRVPRGTPVRVTITNPLAVALVVHGLSGRTGPDLDSLVVPAGGRAEARFVADLEGTYYYWATTTGVALDDRIFEDAQLHGAFVVDPPGAIGPPRDRILILGAWADGRDSTGDPDGSREFFTINGRPWPHTERLAYRMGDSVHWRIINASLAPHPMHLHGFYFRVDARGDLALDSLYERRRQRMAVTELMEPGSSMRMSWMPDRPGGWVFHCHLSFHVIANPRLGAERLTREERVREVFVGHPDHDPHNHVQRAMGGLMLGMEVAPAPGWQPDPRPGRVLRLFVNSNAPKGDSAARFAFVLGEGPADPSPDSIRAPGSTLVLERGEPTVIRVINRSPEPTQVHWHGLEIESPFDGVAGIGGYPGRRTPAILPGDSFEVRVTPPRAGSFMYHTHLNDIRQQSRGLAGALLVVDDRETWDAGTDHILLIASDADIEPILNGRREHPALEWKLGQEYRVRLMNVTLANPGLRARLVNARGVVLAWTPLAQDGHDLPPAQRARGLALTRIGIGETRDFAFDLRQPGEYALEILTGNYRLVTRQPIRVTR